MGFSISIQPDGNSPNVRLGLFVIELYGVNCSRLEPVRMFYSRSSGLTRKATMPLMTLG